MNNYNYHVNMSKNTNDRMYNRASNQQNDEQGKLSNNNSNKNNTLKRTESKMDENQHEVDNDPTAESDIDKRQWRQQSRTESFVQGRTIASSIQSNERTEKNYTRYTSSQQRERKNEENHDIWQLTNCDDEQYDSNNCLQNCDGQQLVEHEHEQIYISRHAMKFAVEERFPSLKIKCEPVRKTQNDASLVVKELLNHFEKNFRNMNPRQNNPFGFDHFMVDKNGVLICFTNYIELFIFKCDIKNYPAVVHNIKIQPLLPTKLPAKNAIILKFIDNKIKLEDIQIIIKDKFESVYAVKEMSGTITYRSRHIRVDLLSKEEYINVLNIGKIVIDSHLYEIDEYLPAPKILICNKCNTPGHIKKNCKSSIDICKRCGNDRNDGANHKDCNIKCHHCGGDHEATNFKCTIISQYRQELLRQLKNNTRLLPPC